jgi:tetratricopeptide (TPR) repeat protein
MQLAQNKASDPSLIEFFQRFFCFCVHFRTPCLIAILTALATDEHRLSGGDTAVELPARWKTMRGKRANWLLGVAVAWAVSFSAAQANAAPRPKRAQGERLGQVSFPISCAPDVQQTFNAGVALLHNFQYEEAEQTFSQVAQQDPTCAMAYWGKAMSLYHQLWDWPSDATLKEGHDDTMQALQLRAKTDQERMYVVAAGVFFQANSNLSKASRIKAYSDWMGRIFTKYPDDVNAGAFYALSLITIPGKKSDQDANREQAIDILDKLMAVAPDNPGVLHYLIHASDTPELAPQGLVAARRYAKIAPDSSHALHMPSHIFVRLGLWQEAIDSNVAAEAAAAQATQAGKADATYQFHAMDFLNYVYLQSGQAAKAQEIIGELKSVPGATPDEISRSTAELTARNALELHDWKDAATLAVPEAKDDSQESVYLARTIGAARMGDVVGATQDVAQLNQETSADDGATKQGSSGMYGAANNVPNLEAEAWLDYAQGKHEEAVKVMRAAAKKEEADGVDSLTMPAREMLGDMLVEMKEPAEALVEYKAALVESPNRFDSLYGAAQAAELSGNSAEAHKYYAKLVEICGPGADRQELAQAREQVAKK